MTEAFECDVCGKLFAGQAKWKFQHTSYICVFHICDGCAFKTFHRLISRKKWFQEDDDLRVQYQDNMK